MPNWTSKPTKRTSIPLFSLSLARPLFPVRTQNILIPPPLSHTHYNSPESTKTIAELLHTQFISSKDAYHSNRTRFFYLYYNNNNNNYDHEMGSDIPQQESTLNILSIPTSDPCQAIKEGIALITHARGRGVKTLLIHLEWLSLTECAIKESDANEVMLDS